MKSELQMTFRNVQPSEEVQGWIRAQAAELDTLYGQLMRCRVTIRVPHRHHGKGNRYHICLNRTVPFGEIIVKREPSLGTQARQLGERQIRKRAEVNAPHKYLRAAINEAFKVAGRRLHDYARRQRRDIKVHVPLPGARVSRLFRDEGYGFLAAGDGHEVYFHKDSVLGLGFGRLKVGTVVSFVEEPGGKDPQAGTVRVRPRQGTQAVKSMVPLTN